MALDFADFSPTALDEDEYLRECIRTDPDNIRHEFIRVPADLAYWGEQYALAVRTYLRAKQTRKETYAKVHLIVKEQAALKGQKISEKDTESWVEQTPEVIAANQAEIEAEADMHVMRSRRDAVMAKKDMCMSLGAHIRAELGPSHINARD